MLKRRVAAGNKDTVPSHAGFCPTGTAGGLENKKTVRPVGGGVPLFYVKKIRKRISQFFADIHGMFRIRKELRHL